MALGRKTGGRQIGTPNKLNGDVRGLILAALTQAGGVDYLARQANEQPVAFMNLIGKVLPLQVTGANGAAIAVDFRWADATPADVATTVVAQTIEGEAEQAETLIEWEPPKLAND